MPFYQKEGTSYVRVQGPTDIKDQKGGLLCSLMPDIEDPEKLTVKPVAEQVILIRTEKGYVSLYGQTHEINRDDFFIQNLNSRTAEIKVVIHSEKPMA